MAAKTYLIVDDTTEETVGLFTCDDDPELTQPFGGIGQHLVDDPTAVEEVLAARRALPPPIDWFSQFV